MNKLCFQLKDQKNKHHKFIQIHKKQILQIKIQKERQTYLVLVGQNMDRQTLRQIIFEGKLMQKQNFRANKISELGQLRVGQIPNVAGNTCLLGSLQMNKKNIIPETPGIDKFEIVQLKRAKLNTPKKQTSKFITTLKSQMRNRQIRSHRESFKTDRIQHSQLGVFFKSLGIKYIQKPIYFIQGQVITNHKGHQPKKPEHAYRFQHGKSSLNIELFPQKLIPPQVVGSKPQVRVYQDKKNKTFRERNQQAKKSFNIDFKSSKFNLSQVNKDSQQSVNQQLCSSQLNNQVFLNKTTAKQFSCIHRTSSMFGYPKKSILKRIFQQQRQFQCKLQKQKKQALQIRKQVNRNYAKPFNPPENISAQSYIVYEITRKVSPYRKLSQLNTEKRRFVNSHKILVQHNSRSPIEVASLTKIMTFVVALQICQKYNKHPQKQLVRICHFQQNISGTTAGLVKGQTYTLKQLFYGLMLPSGNDASLAIAVWGGRVIIQSSQNSPINTQSCQNKIKRLFYQKFLQEMNKKTQQLGMQKTNYANSHGLMNFQNKSCAFDLALLCEHALKDQRFREVVSTRYFQCQVQSQKQVQQTVLSSTFTNTSQKKLQIGQAEEAKDLYANQNQQQQTFSQKVNNTDNFNSQVDIDSQYFRINNLFTKKVFWQNTHLLVQNKPCIYKGIKTGITNAAGPCLSSQIQLNNRQFIIIVLNCRTMKQRFRDTQNLRKWTFQKQQIIIQE